MNKTELAIGVFDSGMGGLTVLRALHQVLPQESFIYLGDTARLPYGTKSTATVQQYAVQMARILVERRIKALVIACNTATTAALEHLQMMLPDLPVIGVVGPGADAAVAATRNHRIAVLATETTIASQAYQRRLRTNLPKVSIYARACSVLVALAEEGMVSHAVTREALLYYLDGLQDEDTILLGCTHFPVFKQFMTTLLPSTIALIDPSEATAHALKQILEQKNLLNPQQSRLASTQYIVTDSAHRFRQVGKIFLGKSLTQEDVELIDAVTETKVLGCSSFKTTSNFTKMHNSL